MLNRRRLAKEKMYKQIAEQLGVSEAAVWRYAKSKNKTKIEELAKMAKDLKLSNETVLKYFVEN